MPIKLCQHDCYTHFEYLHCTIDIRNQNIDIYVIYRPPPSPTNGLSVAGFMEEWYSFISSHSLSKSEIIIVGDINFHVENIDLCNTRKFMQSLDCHDLQQNIVDPTHYCGHVLDVLISRSSSTLLQGIYVSDIALCNNEGQVLNDHYSIICNVDFPIPKVEQKSISYRRFRDIDIVSFKSDIISSSTLNDLEGTASELADRYITGLQAIIDKHAPLITRNETIKRHDPWFTNNNHVAKRQRRKAERRSRRTKETTDHKEYRRQCCARTRLLESSKTEYYSTKIVESHGNQKLLFNITNQLISNHQANRLPTSDNEVDLAIRFGAYFHDKIVNIRKQFISHPTSEQIIHNFTGLNMLRPTTSEEITQMISSSASKHCQLDPIPTWLLKLCTDELMPILLAMFNTSLASGEFPHQFKVGLVKPLLKQGKLDTDELKNYRPVSNLHYVSKILEKLTVARLEEHLQVHSLYDPFQSAYKSGYSTETALMHLSNCILTSLDAGKCVLLAALDLSAAFDTIDHTLFLKRLHSLYGVGDVALQWFKSYLSSRKQRVSINSALSNCRTIVSGVPQGSVLGARLFTMYTKPLSDIIHAHNIRYNCYADDTQLYIESNNDDSSIQHATKILENCIHDICVWMNNNALKLNEDKTEYIVFNNSINYAGTKQLIVGSNNVDATNELRILGVTFDYKMTMEKHVTNSCRSAHIQTRKIRSIRKYLTVNASKIITQSLVTVRLDYCNSMYVGLPLKTIRRLQISHNNAARVVSRVSRYDHITGVLKSLHWLPIHRRCQFKLLIMTYKALHRNAPSYICDSLQWYQPARPLRSGSTTSLVPKRHRTIRLGRRILDTSTATLWNTLPHHIKAAKDIQTFKKQVKTFLFSM